MLQTGLEPRTMLAATTGSAVAAAAMTVGSGEKSCGSTLRPRKMAVAVTQPTLTPICSSRFT